MSICGVNLTLTAKNLIERLLVKLLYDRRFDAFQRTRAVKARFQWATQYSVNGSELRRQLPMEQEGTGSCQRHTSNCPKLRGKIIRLLRIHQDTGEVTNVQIELTDGASFICYFAVRPEVEASLYKGGAGTPETIRTDEL